MNCPTCGTANVPGAKFCVECGTKLAGACPTCGTANAPGAKFCVECGTNLAGGIAASQPAEGPEPTTAGGTAQPAGAERRLVSVLFADLVGSTTLAEDRDPEESRELLSRYFEVASDLIGNYGGTIEKFIGDAVMAVWGVPTAHEDDAERAVRAGLDLVSAVGGITDASSGQPLQLRAAVLTGEAAATIGASGQGMVAGDLVNTASRLQGAAPPGSVLVGEATYRATSGAIGYEEAGEQVLKGRTASVAAWRAVQVLGMRGGARRRAALEAPFVGREEELRLVKDLFHATVREAKPRLVMIIGQAGIGKSRLGWEFEKYLDGVTLTAYWHAGRSPSYGEGISFWALAEMVRERAGIAESDTPEEARAKLSACLAEWLTDSDERRWVEPRLLGLLGLEEMPAGQREELFAAWRTFFERIAERGPVVMVFKDLHWADAGLLEFIEHLLNWAKAHPIYVLAMTRPDLLERHPGWGTGVRNLTTISLEPLGNEPMRELLHGLVPGLPDDAISAIVARAEGVPLYAVETVRMLIDRGQLQSTGDGYLLAEPIDRLAVPETLHALVAARIDANEPDDRALLADGAVLGQSFTPAALAGLTGRDEAALTAGLDRLVRRELLIRDDDPRSPERGQYRFVQAVVREVAYETLAKADRRAKHLAAARHFEALGEEELAGVLASHYLEALRATPPGPEADALAAQTRIALRAAADRAASLHSWAVSYHHLVDALGITTEPAEVAALQLAVADAAHTLLRPDAIDHALEAAAVADRLGDRAIANRARAKAGQIYTDRMQGAAALEILEPAAVGLSEEEPGAADILGGLARIYMMNDRHEEAVVASERALRAAAPEREAEVIIHALVSRAPAIAALGRVDEAEAMLRGAVALADKEGNINAALRARNNLRSTTTEDAPIREWLAIVDEAVDMAKRFGLPGWVTWYAGARSIAYLELGEWEAAQRDLDEVADLEPRGFVGSFLAAIQACVFALEGDVQGARKALADSERLGSKVDTLPQLTELASDRSRAWLLVGDFTAAAAAVAGLEGGGNDAWLWLRGATAAASLGNDETVASLLPRIESLNRRRFPRTVSSALRAKAAALAGRWDDALAAYLTAIPAFQAMDYHLDAAMLGLECGAFLSAHDERAGAAAEVAAAWMAERGAEGVVERYRAAFKGNPAPAATRTGAGTSAVRVDAEQPA